MDHKWCSPLHHLIFFFSSYLFFSSFFEDHSHAFNEVHVALILQVPERPSMLDPHFVRVGHFVPTVCLSLSTLLQVQGVLFPAVEIRRHQHSRGCSGSAAVMKGRCFIGAEWRLGWAAVGKGNDSIRCFTGFPLRLFGAKIHSL